MSPPFRGGCAALLALALAGAPAAAPQGPGKARTLEEDRLVLLGEWQRGPVRDGDATITTKIRISDRDVRMFIVWQTPASFEAGGSQFEYQLTEKDGRRVLVLFGANRDQATGAVTYQLDGDRLRLSGAGVAFNNRPYDLTGEWTRPKKKKAGRPGS